jgi:16S rRNA (cytosine1402-N4)-methyltransferase
MAFMTDEATPHKRRIRYKGTHPRRFEEKYKELEPERFQDELAKVAARGHTPAGTHRPICVAEILEVLDLHPGDQVLDATLGYGGHARELLARLQPGGRLLGLDVDPLELPRTEARLRALGFGEETFQVRRTNFAALAKVVAEEGRGFDGILADLGVSSMQIDNPERGFTFKADGPLDLRLNPQKGQPVSAFLRTVREDQLQALLEENADEPRAALLAPAILARRMELDTTRKLAEAVLDALRSVGETDADANRVTLQRTFQALRIAVNDEFGVLERFLLALPQALAPGGRVAILTFHSGEDRRVKKAFQQGFREGVYAAIAQEPIRPGAEERRANPRSSCAKLRWARRA